MHLRAAVEAWGGESAGLKNGTAGGPAIRLSSSVATPATARTPIPTFFVNRDRDEERRAAIELELENASIVGERIAGVEGLAVPWDLRPFFFDGDSPPTQLDGGEVGCYASHLKAMKIIVERRLGYALIIEDDALLPGDLNATIDSVLENLPDEWDLVHLCNEPCRAVKTLAQIGNSRTLIRYSRVPAGTVGYLVSYAGAKKFLVPVKRIWPVDTDFRRPWEFGMEVYGVAPKVIGHNGELPAAIQSRSRRRRGIPVPSAKCWYGNPLHSPQGALYNIKALGPLRWMSCLLQNTLRRAVRGVGLDLPARAR